MIRPIWGIESNCLRSTTISYPRWPSCTGCRDKNVIFSIKPLNTACNRTRTRTVNSWNQWFFCYCCSNYISKIGNFSSTIRIWVWTISFNVVACTTRWKGYCKIICNRVLCSFWVGWGCDEPHAYHSLRTPGTSSCRCRAWYILIYCD